MPVAVFLVHQMEASTSGELSTCNIGKIESTEAFETDIVGMFVAEWCAAGRNGRPRTIAIVDDDPPGQFLYPEMLLARELLDRNGFKSFVVNPGRLTFDGEALMFGDRTIDMVYNRLTDFQLSSSANAALRSALLNDKAVISPAPRHHALFADKRNLIALADRKRLLAWGLSKTHADALSDIPRTVAVTREAADALWTDRRKFFFKPADGYGGRGAYRGDKLSRRAWSDILSGDYIAQAFVPPPMRGIALENGPAELKFDVRIYTYAGKPLGMAARMYQGQTTNFRTDGGGFAPVIRYIANAHLPTAA